MVLGVSNASAFVYSTAAVVVKSAVIVGVTGVALAAIGYGLEKAGEKLADVGRRNGKPSLENMGNNSTWLGRKVSVAGKYTLTAVAVSGYGIGKWTIQVALPKIRDLARDYVWTPVSTRVHNHLPRVALQITRGYNWVDANVAQPVTNRVITPAYNYTVQTRPYATVTTVAQDLDAKLVDVQARVARVFA